MKIIYSLILLTNLALMLGCTKQPLPKQAWNEDMLKGDWIMYLKNNELDLPYIVLSLQDSTCSYPGPCCIFSPYLVHGNTLILHEYFWYRWSTLETRGRYYYLNILAGNDTSLTLRQQGIIGANYRVGDTLTLRRIPSKHAEMFSRLKLQCRQSGLGGRPGVNMELDSAGLYTIVQQQKVYKGQLQPNVLEEINRKLQYIALDSLDNDYAPPSVDCQTCSLQIQTSRQVYQTIIWDTHDAPVQLKLLLQELMQPWSLKIVE